MSSPSLSPSLPISLPPGEDTQRSKMKKDPGSRVPGCLHCAPNRLGKMQRDTGVEAREAQEQSLDRTLRGQRKSKGLWAP